MRRKFNERGKRMSSQMSKAIRLIAMTAALLFILLWICAPVAIAIASTSKVEIVDSQKEEFTTNTESTTPEVESDSSSGPEVGTEDKGEVSQELETDSESVADEELENLVQVEDEGKKFVLTDEEKEMFAAIIYLEGGGESYECQLGIGSVILNRLESGYWGNTLEDVLYAKNQFTPAHRIKSTTPTNTQRKVVKQLLTEGTTLPYYVMYFRAWYYFSWAESYTNIDDTYFSYLEKDK